VEIIKKKSPKATFVDFHGCGSFHRLPLPPVSFFLLLFLSLRERCRARIAYKRRSTTEPARTSTVFGRREHSFSRVPNLPPLMFAPEADAAFDDCKSDRQPIPICVGHHVERCTCPAYRTIPPIGPFGEHMVEGRRRLAGFESQ